MVRLLLTAGYAVLLATVLGIEFRAELFVGERRETSEIEHNAVEDFTYRLLTGAGFHSNRAKTVRLVTMDRSTEGNELTDNVCPQREFLSVVLQNLEDAGVAGIVLDKHFSGTSCVPDDARSLALVTVLQKARIPITIGLHTENEVGPDGVLKVIASDLIDPLNAPPMLRFGLTRFNRDTRKIPLEWPLAMGGNATQFPTLSLAAAEASDSLLKNDLQALLAAHHHPYAAFMRPEDLPRWSAASVYCLNPRVSFNGIDCARVPHETMDLRGKIALIGVPSNDGHASPEGSLSGPELHANYIEALLQQNYFVPLAHWLSLLIIAVGAGAIQLTFWRTTKPWHAFAWCLSGLMLAGFLGYWALIQLQLFVPPVCDIGGLFVFVVLRLVDTHGHNLAHSVAPQPPAAEPTAPKLSPTSVSLPLPSLPTPVESNGGTVSSNPPSLAGSIDANASNAPPPAIPVPEPKKEIGKTDYVDG
ncbi:MAG TPA: CHASE2 domain-containing protein [Polyangiaceae bacterium]|nr:CHASE2 domain-containing protein [Polyangiaceae bacterium]